MTKRDMAWIALVRHGITEWNERGRIQGRTDIGLNARGLAEAQQARLCDDFLRAQWMTSPLQRAVQTAARLNPQAHPSIHTDLIETNWGDFEGNRRDELPQRIRELKLIPSFGLDFRPPNGESARMVRCRLLRWFATLIGSDSPIVAVTHKGVIRCALSAACDWDMNDEFHAHVDWSLPHIFVVDGDGGDGDGGEDGGEVRVRLVRLNCPWDESPIQ